MSVFRIAVVGKLNGVDETRNVFTLDSGAAGYPDSAEINTWLDTMYTVGFLTVISSLWTAVRWVLEVPILGGWQYTAESPYIRAGSNGASDPLPNQMAVVVIGVTPSRRRGKKFIAALTESNQTGGIVSAGALAAFQTWGNAYILPMTVGAGSAESGVCRPDGTDFIGFVAARVDTIMGTQRRRKQGVGS